MQESPLGAPGSELGLVDGALGVGQVLDGEGLSALNKGNLRNLPKTKKVSGMGLTSNHHLVLYLIVIS